MTLNNDNFSRMKVKNIGDLLEGFLSKVEARYNKNPSHISELWFEVLGSKFANMTEVISFDRGTLFIRVKNSILFSILNNYEKENLLRKMQKKISKEVIQKINFKIG